MNYEQKALDDALEIFDAVGWKVSIEHSYGNPHYCVLDMTESKRLSTGNEYVLLASATGFQEGYKAGIRNDQLR